MSTSSPTPPPSDALVNPRDVLRADAEVRRRGQDEVLWELEKREPDLAEFLFEELSLVQRRLDEAGLSPKQVRRLDRRVERLCLVALLALRHATLRLLNGSEEQAAHEPGGSEVVDPPRPEEPPEGGDQP